MGGDSLEIKKSNHYYKGLYQELILPHPVCWKSQEHLALCQMSDQSILTQSQKEKKKRGEKGNKENPQPH